MRVLSGIQPTGPFHWGNYFGAIRQYIELQDGNEAYYFIANLHALTTIRQPVAAMAVADKREARTGRESRLARAVYRLMRR